MSKRPLSPPQPTAAECLDFEAWKIEQAGGNGRKRTDDTVYDPSIEDLPDHPWYALDDQTLKNNILRMCDELGRPVVDCEINDPQIHELLGALARAKKTPGPRQVNIAVVGSQGVGKSSTLNALLNRDLVDASASSSACTAFATIIQYKEGSADDTTLSDLKVTFLEIDEIRDFIEEHIRRYADVYTSTEGNEDEPAAEEEDTQDASDIDVSDSDFSDAEDSPTANKKPRKKVSKALQAGADTAEQFFRIIFGGHQDQSKEAELQEWLNRPDLEDGKFLGHCVKVASEHLAQIQAEEAGSVEYSDVQDTDLQKVRDHATALWPLVKAVTISTGCILLRNGICFMDLPGYGDLNQTRTAVVNEYRRKANFEIVVAKSDRYLSKTDEVRFLHRAIRHHEANNVFLSCLETPQNQVVRMLQDDVEEPFLTINQHFSGLKALRGESRSVVKQYRRYLIREAQLASGRRECDKIRQKMQRKGVQVFPVSSARYLDWLDPSPLEDPPFDAQGTGIPALRRALLMLRNNGFATHGKVKSKNMNDELLQTYKSTIKQWKYKTTPKINDVINELDKPVRVTLEQISKSLHEAPSDPVLKQLVGENLEKRTRRIVQNRNGLVEKLQASKAENYRYFTTEDDIKCPVAKSLKKAYARINLIRMDERPKHRNGIYKQQRANFINTITKDNDGARPLVEAISAKVKTRQCKDWQVHEDQFITSVIGHFEEFAQALAELLENEIYMLEAHRLVREQLGQLVQGFGKELGMIKGQFTEYDTQRAAKKARTVVVKKEEVE
ncbi:hypothetical protein E8E11_010428 [Didymella keratinophila]|nr:hypothetical protein E8E11_010428 [Didymella keratinophila]